VIVFEQLKTRRARARYERRLRAWRAQREECARQLELCEEFTGEPTREIVLARGEALFFQMSGASLIEERVVGGHYEGGYSGLSVPIGRIGGRALRYNLGASRGHYVRDPPVPTVIDTGEVFITNRRVIFQGKSQTRECRFAQLLRAEHLDDGSTTLSLSNRQRPTRLHYGAELAPAVAFHLELALAHYSGTVHSLIGDLRARLEEIDGERPLEPASAALELTGGLDLAEGDSGVPDDETAASDLDESPFGDRRCERRARRWP
jgi:hypothetical protein